MISNGAAIVESLRDQTQAPGFFWSPATVSKIAGEKVDHWKKLEPEAIAALTVELLEAVAAAPDWGVSTFVKKMVEGLLRKPVPFTEDQALRACRCLCAPRVDFPYKPVLKSLDATPRTEPFRAALQELRGKIDPYWVGGSAAKDIFEKIDGLLGVERYRAGKPEGKWSERVLHDTAGLAAWQDLIEYWTSLTQSEASMKWRDGAEERIAKIGREDFLKRAQAWLEMDPMPENTLAQVPEKEADYQKGFIWSVGALSDVALAGGVADFAVACFRKIPQVGAVSQRVGNACVNALALMPGLAAVAHLNRLSQRVKYDVALRLIEKALEGAAQRNGLSREDLEAMSVPRFGLDAEGVRLETAGDCQARLTVNSEGAQLVWSRGAKPLKSVPAEAKSKHAELVKECKRIEKELDAMVGAQRQRLERHLMTRPETALSQWREWYIDHPVTAVHARRLVWEFLESDRRFLGFWRDGRILDWAGAEQRPSPEARVRLWHPIDSDPQTVLSWRCWLEDQGVRQPFKQAHREVYILTEAERRTETYSNRFAAHILRQHQFAALCRERGWQYNLMGQWDSHNTPTLDLPRLGLRAEFFVDSPANEEVSDHAIYLLIATGQVRFVRGREAVRLEEIPPVVFSEVLRDVDLFVGVTSIGNDPAWGQRATPAYGPYWESFAFGDLSLAAEGRRDVVSRLLPKLAIRDRCRVEGRFLHVRGQLQEYKIHMGSGNVQMEPGSRYLCIVQGPGDSADRVLLPFEQDRTLSAILSKAFLLVADDKIKDETIVRQLR